MALLVRVEEDLAQRPPIGLHYTRLLRHGERKSQPLVLCQRPRRIGHLLHDALTADWLEAQLPLPDSILARSSRSLISEQMLGAVPDGAQLLTLVRRPVAPGKPSGAYR